MTSPQAVLGPWHRTLSAVLLAAYLPACTSWQMGTPSPETFVTTEHPERVRVTRTDGATLTLHAPFVRGDSLLGIRARGLAQPERGDTLGLPLSEVRRVDVRRTNTTGTLLVVGVGLVAVIVIGACAASDSDQLYDPC